jgi:catechol 2,3-dioxygenase-like lactoylglutathione lyase family enzyme
VAVALGEPVGFAPCTDLEQARVFYRDVLGLDEVEQSPYAVVLRSGSGSVRVTLVESFTAQPFTVLGWLVDDIAAEMRALAGRGVDPVRYDGMGQDDLGVWHTPGGDAVAWFHDPFGNLLSLTQYGAQ